MYMCIYSYWSFPWLSESRNHTHDVVFCTLLDNKFVSNWKKKIEIEIEKIVLSYMAMSYIVRRCCHENISWLELSYIYLYGVWFAESEMHVWSVQRACDEMPIESIIKHAKCLGNSSCLSAQRIIMDTCNLTQCPHDSALSQLWMFLIEEISTWF